MLYVATYNLQIFYKPNVDIIIKMSGIKSNNPPTIHHLYLPDGRDDPGVNNPL